MEEYEPTRKYKCIFYDDCLDTFARKGKMPCDDNCQEYEEGEPWRNDDPQAVQELLNTIFDDIYKGED